MNKALEAARAAAQARRESGEVVERLDPMEKAARRPTSLRLAINAKCYDCMGRDGDPNWRKRISECSVRSCSLRPVRPYQADGEVEE